MGVTAKTLGEVTVGCPDDPAVFLCEHDKVLSRGQLHNAVLALAGTLRKSGIRPGDIVSIADANTVHSV